MNDNQKGFPSDNDWLRVTEKPIENDIEWFNNFKFITPAVMVDGDLELKLEETCPYNPEKGHVPEYKFAMVHTTSQAIMGRVRLRVGLIKNLNNFGGHVGYEVAQPYQGNHYAARSCRLLFPLIQKLGINPVVITCAPENLPSVKTIESLGARLAATKDVEIKSGTLQLRNIYYLYFEENKS